MGIAEAATLASIRPPNQTYRIHSRFLATRQGKKELVDYVQELRALIAAMEVDPLPEAVAVTVFMEGLRTGVARSEVFRTHPTSFEEAVNVALNSEFNFKSLQLGWNASYANLSSGPEPMDLSYTEDENAELRAAEQRRHPRIICVWRHTPPAGRLSRAQPPPGSFERKPCDGPELWFVSGKREVPGCQLYAEALRACERDFVSRQAPVLRCLRSVNIGVKFLDFDSVEHCLVLALDARYDLILGMSWMERHEPWGDWRSKTLGASHLSPCVALSSHEPTSARKQKRFWREHWTEAVNALGIGMPEMMDTESRGQESRAELVG
ncbi:unnamed protein product [Phytophthora fragariaefolia]|uniref:Unnamed protein product n=1 Tax=Phytophthora fragariaefolia TaxID=1490495 RepID=A0A9W6YQ65_9STRA|nr:unnamed protein product [Phytophthora fragariaefolia]